MSPDERTIRKEVEREFRDGWDQVLESQGRRGEARLTEPERAQAMSIAMRGAVFWGLVAEGLSILALVILAISNGAWPASEEWMALLNGPIVLVGYFLFKRQRLLDRSAAMWREKRQQLVAEEVLRRIQRVGKDI